MAKNQKNCTICGQSVHKNRIHHSKTGKILCTTCFRAKMREIVKNEVKTESYDAISDGNPTDIPSFQSLLCTKQLQIHHLQSNLSFKSLQTHQILSEIELLQVDLRELTVQRIDRDYKVSCVMRREQISNLLCPDCVSKLPAPVIRRSVGSFEVKHNKSEVADKSCASKCRLM